MTDRELLEAAARAAGYSLVWGEVHRVGDTDVDCTDLAYIVSSDREESPAYWNPLTDDGDALRLAVKLGISIVPNYLASQESMGVIEFTELADSADICAATRRAIVRAAAALSVSQGTGSQEGRNG